MKKQIIIFDKKFTKSIFLQKLSQANPEVDVFSLTPEWQFIDESILCHKEYQFSVLNSSKLIDEQVVLIQKNVAAWSADLADYHIDKKPIKSWFKLDESEGSSWWYSLISEKNPFKTDVFLRLAQLQAIEKLFRENSYVSCLISIENPDCKDVIVKLCQKYEIRLELLDQDQNFVVKFKKNILHRLKKSTLVMEIATGIVWFLVFCLRSLYTKLKLGRISKRNFDASRCFISYFPAVDMDSLSKGIFKNKYAMPLQEKFNELNLDVCWIFMFVYIDGWSFKDAVKITHRVIKSGNKAVMLHEFMSFRLIFRIFTLWLRQILTFRIMLKKMDRAAIVQGLTTEENATILIKLFQQSFCGKIGIEGIVFHELFKTIIKTFPNIKKYLYYAEMQAWEKALNTAKHDANNGIQTIGFQHASFSNNYFNYFYEPREMVRGNGSLYLPCPDILASSGKLPNELLLKSGYPNIRIVESVRQLYLDSLLNTKKEHEPPQKEFVILVAGTIFQEETRAMVALVAQTFEKQSKNVSIWLKGHPSMPIRSVMENMNLSPEKTGFKIWDEENVGLSTLFEKSSIVVTGTSTACIEALAFGCDVIIPVFSSCLCMSPLKGFDDYCHIVYGPDDLLQTLDRIRSCEKIKEETDKKIQFIKKYWCIDPSLKRWEKIL